MAADAELAGATLLDGDETEGLIPSFVATRGQLNELEADNILAGQRWALHFRPRRNLLTEAFLLELHRRMLGGVWTWAGTYRKSNTNIGADWTTLPASTRDFCLDVAAWAETRAFEPREIAVRMHHRLVQIHPFPNGNGRHSRLLADLWLREKAPPIHWIPTGLAPADARKKYIAALQAADKGDFKPLLRFCGVKP